MKKRGAVSGEVSVDMLSEVESISCNLCGSRDSQQLFVKGGLVIARCTHCGLVFSNPRLAQAEIWKRYSPTYFWDEYMPAHQASNGEYAAEWHRRRNQPFLDLLDRYRPQGQGSLLEIGCAAGFFLKVAEENGWSVTGVEIMSDAVRFARKSLDLDSEGTSTSRLIHICNKTRKDANLARCSRLYPSHWRHRTPDTESIRETG